MAVTSASASPTGETPEARDRRKARTAAQWTFGIVLVAALALVLVPTLGHAGELLDNPFERTEESTVTKVTTGDTPSTKETTSTGATPGTSTETTTTGKKTETTTTVAPADDSLFVTALGNGGLLLVRLGIALLTAFVAAAAVQRAILGRFGVKVGPVEIAELPEIAAQGLEALKDIVSKLEARIKALEERARTAADVTERRALEAEIAEADVALDMTKQRVQRAIDRLRDSGPGNPEFH
ncbi:MAG TPA: hypothetical protein VNB06_18875 [Thermoanaerobaculia bacterium]|nr:hypothetical protein [Thermoanaerobaculia bacterium]